MNLAGGPVFAIGTRVRKAITESGWKCCITPISLSFEMGGGLERQRNLTSILCLSVVTLGWRRHGFVRRIISFVLARGR